MSILTKLKSNKQEKKELVELFNALGDKTRFKLTELLFTNKDLCVSELAELTGISTAGASQQLQVLERAGLVRRERMGQKICYRVESDNPTIEKLMKLIV